MHSELISNYREIIKMVTKEIYLNKRYTRARNSSPFFIYDLGTAFEII